MMSGEIPFDAIATFFIFLIGLPAIVFQWLAPEVRQVVVKRWQELVLDSGLPVLAGLVLLGVGIYLTQSESWQHRWIWFAVMSGFVVLSTVTAVRIPRKYARRTAVVQRLEREAERGINRDGRPQEETLYDLLELGKYSPPGRDKEMVLQALLNLTNRVCERESYDGDRLEDVATGVLDVVLTTPNSGTNQNFATAAEILKRILRAFDSRATLDGMVQVDLLHTMRAMSHLGRAAVEIDSVAMAIIQALGSTGGRHPRTTVAASQALFEIGVRAVERHDMLVAMSSAELLTFMVESQREAIPGPVEGEVVADTLGLLAHFWTSGETGRDYATARLERVRDAMGITLPDALEKTTRHCAETTEFATADLVRQMSRELEVD